jgi:glycosyltransferase involved in cell wall biosynthesis
VTSAPSISIVTPSYNQATYLEETICSVLGQGYPRLEYLILDGGSTDGSRDIIQRYASHLAYWSSQPDGGQYDAINKGFARSSGEIMAWINSDDKYVPGALHVVGEIFGQFPKVEWLTSLHPLVWDDRGRAVACYPRPGYSGRRFLRGENLPGRGWRANEWIQQESTFWRRSLWLRAGGRINPEYSLAGDFALWASFFQHADLYGVETVLGGFRLHSSQKTSRQLARYAQEAEAALRAHGGRPYGRVEAVLTLGLVRVLPVALRRRWRALEPCRVIRHAGRGGGWLAGLR